MPMSNSLSQTLSVETLEDRLTPSGGLDPTFGNGGITTLPPTLGLPQHQSR